ncbi:MAG TPA: O-antigen ligase family protein [Coleofasciculaceae cyanobacterium]|jgi:O-antigen ligase
MWFSELKTAKNWTWFCFSVSIFILPLFPAIGTLGLIVVLVTVWLNNYGKIITSPLNQGLAVLACFLIISSALAEHSQEAWLGLANFLPFFALFIALRYLITKPVQLRELSWLLILPSLPIVILGWGQMFAAWDTPTFIEAILGWQLVPQGVPTGRMSSVFIYTNFLAIYLAIAFILTLGLWLETWQVWQRKSTKLQIQTLLLLTLILIVDISGLVLTSSRNAWGLAIFCFIAYAVYMGWRWLVWGVIGAATAILWASFVPNLGGTQLRQVVPAFIWARLSDQMYERPVETLRITQWQFCWDLIRERPLFGWGLRNFTPLYEAKMNYWFGHPHNLFLMLSAETGIIAAMLLIAVVALVMFQAVRFFLDLSGKNFQLIFFSYLLAFTSYIIFNLTDVTIFDLRVNTFAWILLAAISGVVRKESQKI